MSEFRILLVDDEADQLETLSDILEVRGYTVTGRKSGELALEAISEDLPCHLVIADLRLPGMDGLELVRRIQALPRPPAVIMITGHGSIDSAVKAMKLGALDYLEKPVNPEALLLQVQKAQERQTLVDQNAYFMHELAGRYHIENIIGRSPVMLEVFDKIRSLSASDASVLITGESGTGKELIANHLHYASARQKGPLVKVSCAALAPGVLESELFGHERGAFSGAISSRAGRFEQADGGTLFLDEMGDIPYSTQTKLLRVLQSGEFERVGGNRVLKSDFRLISATNHNLKDQIRKESFRQDLFYRMCVVEIGIPPLRSRREDIPQLVHHFIQIYREKTGKRIEVINEEAMAALGNYNWPGNVREMKNAIEAAFVYCDGEVIQVEHLPAQIHNKETTPADLSRLSIRSLDEVEKAMIELCMAEAKGNKTRAAEMLRITRSTLDSKISKHSLNYPSSEA
jgi:two-component system, NtrC family, response regulator AtoC